MTPARGTLKFADVSPEMFYDDDLTADFCATKHFQVIHLLTGSRTHPTAFPHNALGFGQYLQAAGIVNFTADEVIRPRYPDKLVDGEYFRDQLAGRVLLPARWVWPRLTAPLALYQMARRSSGPITIRYAYRPPAYNAAVGGAEYSDHLFACAIDVAFSNRSDLLRALRDVFLPRWKLPEYGLSIGYHQTAGAKMHCGVWAPETEKAGKPRIWYYGT